MTPPSSRNFTMSITSASTSGFRVNKQWCWLVCLRRRSFLVVQGVTTAHHTGNEGGSPETGFSDSGAQTGMCNAHMLTIRLSSSSVLLSETGRWLIFLNISRDWSGYVYGFLRVVFWLRQDHGQVTIWPTTPGDAGLREPSGPGRIYPACCPTLRIANRPTFARSITGCDTLNETLVVLCLECPSLRL